MSNFFHNTFPLAVFFHSVTKIRKKADFQLVAYERLSPKFQKTEHVIIIW